MSEFQYVELSNACISQEVLQKFNILLKLYILNLGE